MPFYDYTCECCGEFRLLRPMEERNSPAHCPHCALEATRTILAPNLAVMNPMVRKAATINERSRHEPRVSTSRHQCGTGCGCGTSIRPKRTRQSKFGPVQTGKSGSRPWMLGH